MRRIEAVSVAWLKWKSPAKYTVNNLDINLIMAINVVMAISWEILTRETYKWRGY